MEIAFSIEDYTFREGLDRDLSFIGQPVTYYEDPFYF
ncbi:hypothetical protein PPL_03966 [Heterostelium album PN500]|uniref:Uncharacterized protein n=1 Tax=Heterostelium pallidum (strain ATCC 26659 / Pp 5 / PN500) TaxID=670386 RepID=D3B5M8_HETP5|nr:hypothetical protein PPL_03966 [Heterostelium album PN500]EFA83176.1 hypothetical protein PPL_03966 [Heterostelium album PN500]|eukprot:XP_020435293.1 hypothetical protein PPL_03966 [Heterostelium album PN500]